MHSTGRIVRPGTYLLRQLHNCKSAKRSEPDVIVVIIPCVQSFLEAVNDLSLGDDPLSLIGVSVLEADDEVSESARKPVSNL